MSRFRTSKARRNRVMIVYGIIAAIALAVPYFSYQYGTTDERMITVEDRERVCDGRRDCRYLIFTDNGVLENTDSLAHGKFRSSDVYADLEPGARFQVRTYGYRVGILSWYPNIIEYERLDDEPHDEPDDEEARADG